MTTIFRAKVTNGRVRFAVRAGLYKAGSLCDTPVKALEDFCTKNQFRFSNPRGSTYWMFSDVKLQEECRRLHSVFIGALQQEHKTANNVQKTKKLADVVSTIKGGDFKVNNEPPKFEGSSIRKVVRRMLVKLQGCLYEGSDPENRARLVLVQLFDHHQVRPILELELERRWQWNLKSQKVVANVVKNLQAAIEEYKNGKTTMCRDIYQILLKVVASPVEDRLQRATALLFGLSSRVGLRAVQSKMAEANIIQEGNATGRNHVPTFQPPSKILGDVKYDFAGQLSTEESKTLEEHNAAVIEAREQLAIYLTLVDKLEQKKSATFGNVESLHRQIQLAKEKVTAWTAKFKSAEERLSDFYEGLAHKRDQRNIQIAKENQQRLKNHETLLATYSELLAEITDSSLQPVEQKTSHGSLHIQKRVRQKGKLERKIELLAVLWWVMKTRVTANVRDIAERNGKCYPTHWLEDTIKNFYLKFLSSDPSNLYYDNQVIVRGVSSAMLTADISKSMGVEVVTKKGGKDYCYCTFKSAKELEKIFPLPKNNTCVEGNLTITYGGCKGQKVRVSRRPKIGITKFTSLRPFFVKDVSGSTCVCEKCWEMKNLLRDTISWPHWNDAHPRVSEMVDDLHNLAAPFSPTPVHLLDLFLCPRDEETGQFNMKCCQGQCPRRDNDGKPDPCGWKSYFGEDAAELDISDSKQTSSRNVPLIVKYHSYQTKAFDRPKKNSEQDPDATEKVRTRTVLQTCHKPPSHFLDVLQLSVEDYMEHFAIAVHQDKYEKAMKELILDAKMEECICVDMDFAENYEIVHKIEIQSEHWSHTQVTLYIVITHHQERSDPDDETSDIKRVSEAQIFVSEDGKHDTYFVQHAMDELQKYFKKEKGMTFRRWYINTDGAASHFKNKYTMHSLRVFLEKSGAASVMWETCAPGHGKGPWDGIGAVIKRTIRALEVKDPVQYFHRNAVDVYFTLVDHFHGWKKGLSQRCSVDKFNFFYILKDQVDNAHIKSKRAELDKTKANLEKQLQGKELEEEEKSLLDLQVPENQDSDDPDNDFEEDVQDEEVSDDLLPILDVPDRNLSSKPDPFNNISGPITRPSKANRNDISDLKGIRSHFCFLVENGTNNTLPQNKCRVQMRPLSCSCENCLAFDFSQCRNKNYFSDDTSYILESVSTANFAKTRSTRAIDSAIRRKQARSARIGDFVACENPDKNDRCKFWLAKVVKAATQHRGASKTENGVHFVKGGYFIEIHVYKPKFVCGKVRFEWDRNPYGSGTSAWTVDAESVIFCLPSGSVQSVGRRSQRTGHQGQDAWELKQISDELFDTVMDNYYGKLAELPS